MAMEQSVCIWARILILFSFPDEALPTGSSRVMPPLRKIRMFLVGTGKCNRFTVPNQLIYDYQQPARGYHRGPCNLGKEVDRTCHNRTLKACLEIWTFSLKEIRVNGKYFWTTPIRLSVSVRQPWTNWLLDRQPFVMPIKNGARNINEAPLRPKRDIKTLTKVVLAIFACRNQKKWINLVNSCTWSVKSEQWLMFEGLKSKGPHFRVILWVNELKLYREVSDERKKLKQ